MQIELTKEMIVDEMVKQCDNCYGTGLAPPPSEQMRKRFVAGEKWEKCTKCNGRMKMLTELGKELQCYLNEVFPVL